MGCTRREFLALASVGTLAGVAGCTPAQKEPEPPADDASQETPPVDLAEFESLALDPSAWHYDEEGDIYYQLGLTYCLAPATETYESLAIFVPGAYFDAEKNGDTYTCTVNQKAVVGNFTAATAPILMPINSGALSAQASPTAYGSEGLAPYLERGCVYVYAGFRGRSAAVDTATGSDALIPGGAPWPVVDLKAAIRYLRYNASLLPCDANRVYVFGFGAGGGVSAVLGASGDSALFDPYLEEIGAVTHDASGVAVSDALAGSASWCPVTSYDIADAAYEWCQGQYADGGERAEGAWTRELSRDLAGAYAAWVNDMDLRSSDDSQLTLDETETGVYTMGSYAAALLDEIDEAATHFVQNTAFPYTYTPQRLENPMFPGDPNLATARAADPASQPGTSGDAPADGTGTGEEPAQPVGVSQVQSTIYDSAQSYFASLNEDSWWINYNHRSMSVSVSSLRDFVLHMRPAAPEAAPFDRPDRSSRANQLFGIGEESTLHFSPCVAQTVAAGAQDYAACDGWDEEYETAWAEDLEKVDALETDMAGRVSMMEPLTWLSGHYDAYGQSTVAPHWRVNEGLFDTDVSLCAAANLVFALRKYDGVAEVEHNPVWGRGHVLAERSGSAAANLLDWVVSCCSS